MAVPRAARVPAQQVHVPPQGRRELAGDQPAEAGLVRREHGHLHGQPRRGARTPPHGVLRLAAGPPGRRVPLPPARAHRLPPARRGHLVGGLRRREHRGPGRDHHPRARAVRPPLARGALVGCRARRAGARPGGAPAGGWTGSAALARAHDGPARRARGPARCRGRERPSPRRADRPEPARRYTPDRSRAISRRAARRHPACRGARGARAPRP
jgi:hypothetical protein